MGFEQFADAVTRIGTRALGTREPIAYASGELDPVSIQAVFDDAHRELTIDGATAVHSTQPVLGVRLADLPAAPRKGDRVTVGARSFVVSTVERDGNAGADLMLTEELNA